MGKAKQNNDGEKIVDTPPPQNNIILGFVFGFSHHLNNLNFSIINYTGFFAKNQMVFQ
jgi:hypothetical protein